MSALEPRSVIEAGMSRRLRVVVFGASGRAGREIAIEAVRRGHEVTGVVRDLGGVAGLPGVRFVVGDATRLDDVQRIVSDHDVAVGATRPRAGSEPELVQAARSLLTAVRGTSVRVLLVGGAASLRVPDRNGTMVIDDPRWLRPEARAIGNAGMAQLAVCEATSDVDWTYLSPPASLLVGKRTGVYREATDELVVDGDGRSCISYADLAVAMLDEMEAPRHHRARFTVAY